MKAKPTSKKRRSQAMSDERESTVEGTLKAFKTIVDNFDPYANRELAGATGSASHAAAMELVSDAADLGLVSGVLQGLELTVSLLPNQKEAIVRARKAVDRLADRNRAWIVKASASPNDRAGAPEQKL